MSYQIENGILVKYTPALDEKGAIIPRGVTAIGERAFAGCTKLSCVILPDTVQTIGEGAFFRCRDLSTIAVPSSVTSIGAYAFMGCSSLRKLRIPDSVRQIGRSAFKGMSALQEITLPQGLQELRSGLFQSCTSLRCISIPDSVETIGEYVFSLCSGLSDVTLPCSLQRVGEHAFEYCWQLSFLAPPAQHCDIGAWALHCCPIEHFYFRTKEGGVVIHPLDMDQPAAIWQDASAFFGAKTEEEQKTAFRTLKTRTAAFYIAWHMMQDFANACYEDYFEVHLKDMLYDMIRCNDEWTMEDLIKENLVPKEYCMDLIAYAEYLQRTEIHAMLYWYIGKPCGAWYYYSKFGFCPDSDYIFGR